MSRVMIVNTGTNIELLVKPGDHVLLMVSRDLSNEEVDQLGKQVRAWAPERTSWLVQRALEPAVLTGQTLRPSVGSVPAAALLAGSPVLLGDCLSALDYLWRASVLTDREFEMLTGRVHDTTK